MLWRLKFERLLSAASSVAFVLLIPAAALAISLLGKVQGSSERYPDKVVLIVGVGWMITIALVAGVLALIITIFETLGKYQRLTYEPSLAIKCVDAFDKMAGEERVAAAKALDTYREGGNLRKIKTLKRELEVIDPVLDQLDDVGFYVRGRQLSPEIAHHYFYHWLRGYYQAARTYIDEWQKEEPKQWEQIAWLFEITCQVEKGWCGTDELSPAKLKDFLDEEQRYEAA